MADLLANTPDVAGKTFDYVIVGGGTAGSVLANRLSENPEVSVAILEAGQARFGDAFITGAMSWSHQIKNGEYDWAFPIEVQPKAKNAHSILWNRAKTLGGSSTINAMIYTKPSREEMDALESLGNPGWNWQSYQKYAKKAERMCTPEAGIPDTEYRDLYNPDSVGHDGPVSISFLRTGCGAEVAFQKSVESNGLRINPDALGGDAVGIYKSVSTINQFDGSRSDAATSYLLPVLDRSNLKILTGAHVLKISMHRKGDLLVASGVEFQRGGQTYTISAAREVILAAGTIKTPQILELSGIGDRSILEPLSIPVFVDLPAVGTNAQEHILCTAPMFRIKEGSGVLTAGMLKDSSFAASVRQKYGLQGEYTVVTNCFAFAPVQTFSSEFQSIVDRKKARLDRLDASIPAGVRKVHDVQLKLMENTRVAESEFFVSSNVPVPDTSRAYIAIPPVLSHPWSRGTVHITSADPLANPAINPAYLEDETDLDVLVEAYKYALKISSTSPFKELIDVQVKPATYLDLSDDEKLRQFVSDNITTIWHTCGTAPMLPRDSGGVVDHKLMVYGTTNLRVVDLSTLPLHVAAHPQSYVYSLAEHGNDRYCALSEQKHETLEGTAEQIVSIPYENLIRHFSPHLVPPEYRLQQAMWAAPIFTFSWIWFGWTSYSSISFWVPMMPCGLTGFSMVWIFLALYSYIIDSYLHLAASALAANTIVRSAFRAAFPLFAIDIYDTLNPRWASTLLGILALVMMPIPAVLFKFGPALRKKSRFTVKSFRESIPDAMHTAEADEDA